MMARDMKPGNTARAACGGQATSRRDFLLLGAGLTGAATAATVLPARAMMATMSKAEVGYQDVPSNGRVCAQCVYFEFHPSTGGTLGSLCELVAGPINPAGWCEVWAPKAG